MSERRKITVLVVAFVALTATLMQSGRQLMTTAAPLGIVSYQLAFSAEGAVAVLDSWDPPARDAAAQNLLWDFPYLVVYTWILSLLCRAAGARSIPTISHTGSVVSRYVWFAAIFDTGENFALLYQLSYGASDAAALLAGSAASAKFGVIAIALTFLLVAGMTLWMGRRMDV